MKNSKTLFDDFIREITLLESKDEIMSIGYLVFESYLDISRTDVLMGKLITFEETNVLELKKIAQRINQHEPVQYILGRTEFYGRGFRVNPNVLIPRPETEEMIHEIISRNTGGHMKRLLDIGTGSGCIAVTLKLEIPEASVFALDISDDALTVAKSNAAILQADVNFFQCDILHEDPELNNLDIVVSNPPYIAFEEKSDMHSNVVAHEPHLALFVSNDDPLIFYKTITQRARRMLRKNGALWFEINERFGAQVKAIMIDEGFLDVGILHDTTGKERFVYGKLD
jgi:release factor glutamine methyltransferase